VMSGAMRLLDIAPDRVSKKQLMKVGEIAEDVATDGGKA